MNSYNETIAAISTPPGTGGIGIIRISGPQALAVLQQIFHPHDTSCSFSSHRFYYGRIVDPAYQKTLDEVLVVFMGGPRTYTREDVVEIHCHGSFLVLRSILELILTFSVTLAQPGEFTKRAFLNGRIDLTKAEAVIDILSARTRKGVDMAMDQLSGSLYHQIDSIRTVLVHMRAVVEVAIDFPDEDVEIIDHQLLHNRLTNDIEGPLKKLVAGADKGRIFREGISVVIAGLPNVGKSSLLNSLLQEDRALVTAIPGTTRDTIEETIDIQGLPVRIIDTAGIRDRAEEVEEMGIIRAKEQLGRADLVLFMFDANLGFTEQDQLLYQQVEAKPLIIVHNKIDLADFSDSDYPHCVADTISRVRISAKQQQGIEELKSEIFELVTEGKGQLKEEGCTPNIRHKDALVRALSACGRVKEGLKEKQTCDLVAVDLQECLDQLGEIIGVTTTEDILDVIFEQFCLGK